MATIQQAMYESLGGFAGISALVGARVYPDIAPQDVARPFVVWQEINTEQMNSLAGSVESGGLTNYLIEATCWAATGAGARNLDAQVRAAMIAATQFKSVLSDGQSLGFDPDTKLYGYQSDFSVWLRS